MNKDKVKSFVKEHKKELIAGLGGIVIGVALANYKCSETKTLTKLLKSYQPDKNTGDTIIEDLFMCSNGCNYANTFTGGEGVTIDSMAEHIKEFYTSSGTDLKTEVTGCMMFLHK